MCSACYALRNIKHIIPVDTLRVIYFAHIHSIISYGIIFWGSSYANKVFILQKKIIRIITNTRPRDSCKEVFKHMEIMTLYSQYIYSLVLYTVNNKHLFDTNNAIHKYNSECQCCSHLKRDFQVFVNEIKSMTEIINIQKEELKHDSATKQDQMLVSACEGKPTTSSLQCCNCSQLENQLKEARNELSSVKLITEILNEEIKILKQSSHIDSNAGNSWSIAKSSNSRGSSTARPSKEVHSTHGIPVASQYAVPVANWYAVLSNHHEP